jgi:hypothetical protein
VSVPSAPAAAADAGSAAAARAALIGAPADAAITAAINEATTGILDAKYDRRGEIAILPESYGAKGDGLADDTAAVRAAFDAANGKARTGIVSTIQHPGATVKLTGVYNLASLTTPIQIKCNVADNRATFMVPAAYAGIAVQVGHPDSGGYFTNADINVPDVLKPTSVALVPGSVGVRVQNLGNSILNFGRTYYFETGLHFTGWNQGTVYNQINIGHLSYVKVALKIKPDKAGGWVNQNTFLGGGIQQSPNYGGGGTRRVGWRHVVIDGNGINACDMNRFIGVSLEGDASEYHVELRQAIYNKFEGNRFEQGTLGTAVSVAADTLTDAAHGLAVGDVVTFNAGTVPGGMVLATAYFVTAAPTADTFKVSFKKGGTAVTFTTAGARVVYFRPPRVLIDSTNGLTSANTIEEFFSAQGTLELVDAAGSGGANVINPVGTRIADNYSEPDFPAFRGRNRKASAATRPIFAAYPPAQKPNDNPNGWTMALSDRGLVFAAAETETALLSNAGGVLSYKRPQDTATYEIPSARRSPGLLSVSGLVAAASTTTTTTITLTGAAVNDHVNITMLGHVAGIAVSHGYVSATNVITVVFANLTTAPITFNAKLQAMATRRYY